MKKTVPTIAVLVMLALMPLFTPLFTGCATKSSVEQGSEALVINAEQVQVMALEAVDAFLLFEAQNRETLWKVNPGIKKAADQLRQTFPASNATFLNVLARYKESRTLENRANLNTWLAVLETAKIEAYKWMAESQ